MSIRPAVADADDEVARQERGVAVAMARLQPDHTGHEAMVVGDCAPAHQRGDHRDVHELGELDEQVARIGVDDAAARDDERARGGLQHGDGLLDLLAVRLGFVNGQRFVRLDVELDLRHLHVERQVDQHRTGPARAHEVERLLEGARHLRRLAHRERPLGDGLGDRLDVDRLEVFLVEPRARRLTGHAEDGDGIGDRRIEPRDHVGAGRARGADAHADVARLGAGIAVGHVRGAFDVPREEMADRSALSHRRVERVDRRAGHPERMPHAFLLHHQHRGHDGLHASHVATSLYK